MAMHAANLSKSERLSRLHRLLVRADKPLTSLQIQRKTGSMAVHTDIAELRANGIPVGPARYESTTAEGRRIFSYALEA